MSAVHNFPGVAPFIRRAADTRGCVSPRMVSKATGLEHAAKVQAALGQAVNAARPEDAADIVKNAIEWWESIELAKVGIEAAILDVCQALGLPDPPFAPKLPKHNGHKPPKEVK